MERRPPSVLADFVWYQDGRGMIGQVPKVKLPPLKRVVEEYIAGGMVGAIKLDMGVIETEDLEVTLSEPNIETIKLFGLMNGEERPFVFRGGLLKNGNVESYVVKVMGRLYDLDLGEAERQKVQELTCKITWTTYTILHENTEIVHIDLLGGVERVGGVNLREGLNRALGI